MPTLRGPKTSHSLMGRQTQVAGNMALFFDRIYKNLLT